jgi:hypothetical protein
MTEGLEGDADFKDAKIGGYVGSILFLSSGAVFFVILCVTIVLTINEKNQTGTFPVAGMVLIPGLIVCTGVFGLLGEWSLRKLRMWKRLETRPIIAWATIGTSRPSPTKINTRRLEVFTLTVTPTGGPPYEAEAKWFFPDDLRSVVAPGAVVAVRIDPDDQQNVVIDWPQSRAAWAAKETPGTAP